MNNLMNIFEPEFSKRKTKFIKLATKSCMTKFDEIINQTLL